MTQVSIVTPSYNQADYLEATLRSVLEQDAPPVEYLVIDGGSTDGSVDIIRRYAGRLAGWVSEKDAGQADAINKGLRRASGEIVAWLNSDDLYLPGAIRQAVAALEADPDLGFVYTDAVTIDPAGRPLNRLSFGDWGLPELLGFRIICQPAVFMRRSVLEAAAAAPGVYLDPSYHCMLDHHLWLRLARLAPVRHLPGLWAAARHHPGAKNVAQAPAFGRETLRLLEALGRDPAFAPLVAADRRRVEGGAYRLNARYLLDGGLPGPALRSYAQALRRSPAYTLRHWRRILFALLTVGLPTAGAGRSLAARYYRLRTGRRPDLSTLPGIAGWPGLQV